MESMNLPSSKVCIGHLFERDGKSLMVFAWWCFMRGGGSGRGVDGMCFSVHHSLRIRY